MQLPYFLNFKHMDRIIIFLIVATLFSCRTSKPCLPCAVTEKTDSIVYRTDTLRYWQQIGDLPIIKITCFEHTGKDSIQIFSFPCSSINEQQIVYRTRTILDTNKIIELTDFLQRMRKDSIRTAQKLTDSENRYDKKYYFYRNGFFWVLGISFLLALFFIWRSVKKA